MRPILSAAVAAKSRGGSAVRTGSIWICRHCGSPNLSTSLICRNGC